MILDLLYDEEENCQPCFSNTKIKVAENKQAPLLSYTGLTIIKSISEKLCLAEMINENLLILKKHKPYFESDHILGLVYNFLSGGDTLIDIERLRNDEGLKRLLGTENYPAPTTVGDFLVRFKDEEIRVFRDILGKTQDFALRLLDNKRKKIATIDSDSSIHEVYGEKKEGADYSYTNKWSYDVLYFTLMEMGDLLDIELREGNTYSSKGSNEKLKEIIKRLKSHFERLRYRGDSAFYSKDIVSICEENGVEFFITADQTCRLMEEVLNIPEESWKSLSHKKLGDHSCGKKRKKRKNLKKEISIGRNPLVTRKGKSEVASLLYQPVGWEKEYRFVVKRTEVIEECGQANLDESLCKYTYHIISTNSQESDKKVMKTAQGRGNQENLIKDFKYGLGLSHVPTGFLVANKVYFLIAMLAWNLKTWMLNILCLADGAVMRFKRFLYLWIYQASIVSRTARDLVVIRISKGEYFHRFGRALKRAYSL